jgi:bifunctional DNA-binding transcriptional regulator/antitoxin component of YhaV-PrlF toxin-antitoxin module
LNKELIPATVRKYSAIDTNMAKVTSKYQITIPRTIANEYDIRPGEEIDWVPAGEVIRVVPCGKNAAPQSRESQLRLFDQATERHRQPAPAAKRHGARGWRRKDVYQRGRAR